MKVKIAPESLKPGQQFDAWPVAGQWTFDEMPPPAQNMYFAMISGNEIIAKTGSRFHLLKWTFFTEVSHPELVKALVKPGEHIIQSLTPHTAHLWHMASCIPSEAGELFDAIKKFVIYEKHLDRENVVEELGDLEFYLEGIRAALDITREECLDHNIAKLSKRYADGYSNAAAQARADKAPTVGGPRHTNPVYTDTPDSDHD